MRLVLGTTCVLLASALPLHGQDRGTDAALTVHQAVAIARARGPLAVTAHARRLVAQGRARNDGAFPNPTLEWRRENLTSPLQPDIFGTLQIPLDVTGRRFAVRSAGGELVARGRADSSAVARQIEGDVMRARSASSRVRIAATSATAPSRKRVASKVAMFSRAWRSSVATASSSLPSAARQ